MILVSLDALHLFVFGEIRGHLYLKNATCKRETNSVSEINAKNPSTLVYLDFRLFKNLKFVDQYNALFQSNIAYL